MTSLHKSFLIHSALILLLFLVTWLNPKPHLTQEFEVELLDLSDSKMTDLKPKTVDIKVSQTKPQEQKNQKVPARRVYGLHRKAYTENATHAEDTVQVKTGNTLAKEVDSEKLSDSDPDEYPVPTEDYLITEMPKIISEYKIPYPAKAKKMEITGKVIVDILIDQNGVVRESKLIKGLGFGLDEAALEGVKQYRFSPAKVGENQVAVKIRYAINFILE